MIVTPIFKQIYKDTTDEEYEKVGWYEFVCFYLYEFVPVSPSFQDISSTMANFVFYFYLSLYCLSYTWNDHL